MKSKGRFIGTMYGYTHDASLLKHPDHIEYWLPATRFTGYSFSKGNLAKSTRESFLHEGSNSYGIFLGGDRALIAARTSAANGRRVLLIKNSYGNPFGVWLLNSFEEVYIIDHRYFCGSVLDLIADRKITDLVILAGAFSANSDAHRSRMAKVMHPSPISSVCKPVIPSLELSGHAPK
jgi:hypothetical protein